MKRVRSQPGIAAKIVASNAAFEERTFLATCEADRAAVIQQAKSAEPETQDFTNCGETGQVEKPVKPTQIARRKKLKRVPFKVSRLMEFCSRKELVNQTGHDSYQWALVILKELIDNALDDAEEHGIAPVILVEIFGDVIAVTDNGSGIPEATIASVLDYSIRVSSREAYCSPTRGAQGNALKTILPMAYVLNEGRGEEAVGETIIEAHGVAHHIRFSVDHVSQEPKIERTTSKSNVASGTRVRVQLPPDHGKYDRIGECRDHIIELAEAYIWINPHLSLKLVWNGRQVFDLKAFDTSFRKWMPSWPTSPHWYDVGRLRRYMAAHIANRGNITVREFISEFDGMTSTAKQKAVLAEIGASHMSLHSYFGFTKANTQNIAKLLASLQRHTKPVPPQRLGVIGKDHLYRLMETFGGDPATFTYNRDCGEEKGIPRVIEFAFGVHRDGLADGPTQQRRKIITGVNWSPGISNPFRQLGRYGEGLDAVLANVRANTSQPVIAMLHLVCPRIQYTDRGKTAIVVEDEADNGE